MIIKYRKHGTKLLVTCKQCGKKKWQKYWRAFCYRRGKKVIKKFCDMRCWLKWIKVNAPKGENHPTWKGGIRRNHGGYTFVGQEGHMKAQHRVIMEKYLGRKLLKNELVHHKNGIKSDNHISNLEVVLNNAHRGNVKCPYCSKKFKIK